MIKKIATIVNDSKIITSFQEGTTIIIYYKDIESWKVQNEISYSLNSNISLSDIRDYIRTVILRLEDCKIIIGKTISGLPYNILDRMGFEIFEVESISDSLSISDFLLEDIYSEVQGYENKKDAFLLKVPTSPQQTAIPGVYFLNLIELQEKHPEISSKRALQDFFTSTPFYKLQLICSHVPPWFETFFPTKKLTFSTEELENNKYQVTIYKKVCEC